MKTNCGSLGFAYSRCHGSIFMLFCFDSLACGQLILIWRALFGLRRRALPSTANRVAHSSSLSVHSHSSLAEAAGTVATTTKIGCDEQRVGLRSLGRVKASIIIALISFELLCRNRGTTTPEQSDREWPSIAYKLSWCLGSVAWFLAGFVFIYSRMGQIAATGIYGQVEIVFVRPMRANNMLLSESTPFRERDHHHIRCFAKLDTLALHGCAKCIPQLDSFVWGYYRVCVSESTYSDHRFLSRGSPATTVCITHRIVYIKLALANVEFVSKVLSISALRGYIWQYWICMQIWQSLHNWRAVGRNINTVVA